MEQSTETKEIPSTEDMIYSVIAGWILFWCAFNFISFLYGVQEAERRSCEQPWMRVEYVLPGFRLGCYMGTRVP